jgi:pimeloyl-ACP methyl ester carboxylesterase
MTTQPSPATPPTACEHVTLRHGDLRFRAVVAGRGAVVVLLHGFPDHARSFREQIPVLADAGYRVVAPTLRGYEPSSQPTRPDYSLAALADDVVAWLDDLGVDTAHLIGHDWGAAIAYAAAARAPGRLRSVTGIAVPPAGRRPRLPPRLVAAQLGRWWYMGFFQLPWLPEAALVGQDWKLMRRLWRVWSPEYHLPDGERHALVETMSRPGVLSAALAYYRHNVRRPGQMLRTLRPSPAPTLAITGADDGCVDSRVFDHLDPADFPGGLKVQRVRGAGHWPHLERPDEVNRNILDWLDRNG